MLPQATFKQAIEVSGDVTGKTAFDLSARLAFGDAAGDVVAVSYWNWIRLCTTVCMAVLRFRPP